MREEDIVRERTCCFTGHRPNKLTMGEAALRRRLRAEIDAAAARGYDTFISGMAMGVDVLAAEEVLSAKAENPGLRLVCAIPFHGSYSQFGGGWRARCERIIAGADMCVDICPAYIKGCYHVRNRWMLRHSSLLIAAYNGTPGGTRSTLLAAAEMRVETRVVMLDQ